MNTTSWKLGVVSVAFLGLSLVVIEISRSEGAELGREVAIPRHPKDGEEYEIPPRQLIDFGKKLSTAMWTIQERSAKPKRLWHAALPPPASFWALLLQRLRTQPAK